MSRPPTDRPSDEPVTRELREFVESPRPTDPAGRVRRAMAAAYRPDPRDAAVDDPDTLLYRRLRRLVRALPDGRTVLADTPLLTALVEVTAVRDPSLCIAVLAHYGMALQSLLTLAEPDALAEHRAALRDGTAHGALLLTEIGQAGSHLALRTTATHDPTGGGFVLHTPDDGAAKFANVTASGHRTIGVVHARTIVGGRDRGVFPFLVDLVDESGVRPGVRMSDPAELSDIELGFSLVRFDHLSLPAAHWLNDGARIDAAGDFHDPLPTPHARLRRSLFAPRILWTALPAAMAAMARAAVHATTVHSRHRPSNGPHSPGEPVLHQRSQAESITSAWADAFALTCVARTGAALREVDATTDPGLPAAAPGFTAWGSAGQTSAALKAGSVALVDRLLTECRARCGFAGALTVNRLSAYHGMARGFTQSGGDNQLILHELGHTLHHAAPTSGDPDPTDRPAVLAPDHVDWWPDLARRWTASVLAMPALPPGQEHERFPDLGTAHTARLMADSVRAELRFAGSTSTLDVLAALAALHGINEALRHGTALVAHGLLDRARLQAMASARRRLCDRLLPTLPLLERAWCPTHTAPGPPLGRVDYPAALWTSLAPRHLVRRASPGVGTRETGAAPGSGR
ncbi:hypothetical protein ACN20G_28475 (plasmid) [Streptomyces sp. BI20]|uniref:hypothetical protein n=1 Tax=Streptomyces sp. BI20 TaxID=3403460 RepID=UPI003C73624C